jgi:hypothetical protein
MRNLKIIFGLGCIVGGLWQGAIALYLLGEWTKSPIACVPAALSLALTAVGFFLMAKSDSDSALSVMSKILIATVIGALIVSSAWLDVSIRHQRRVVQMKAKSFLLRPVPEMLQTNYIGGLSASSGVLSRSHGLIARYANHGTIRLTSLMSARKAGVDLELSFCNAAARTNEEARLYMAECTAVVDEVWRMGFWVWIEDTIEMRRLIPGIKEDY